MVADWQVYFTHDFAHNAYNAQTTFLVKKNAGEQTWQWSSFFIVEDFMLQLEVLIVLTFWSNYVNFGDHVCGIAHS